MTSRAPRAPAPTFTTREYERSHGRPPRGRGVWAFQAVDPFTGELAGEVRYCAGTLTEAKRAALRHFRGYSDYVAVLP